jgi:hypothetical protein
MAKESKLWTTSGYIYGNGAGISAFLRQVIRLMSVKIAVAVIAVISSFFLQKRSILMLAMHMALIMWKLVQSVM